MIFFDYLYYHIAKFYSSYREKGAESSSSGIVAGFLTLNVMAIMMFYMMLAKEKPHMNKLIIVILFIIFQVFTYVRYTYRESHSVNLIEQEWLSKTDLYRKRIVTLLFIYGIGSIILTFGLAIYLGSRNSS